MSDTENREHFFSVVLKITEQFIQAYSLYLTGVELAKSKIISSLLSRVVTFFLISIVLAISCWGILQILIFEMLEAYNFGILASLSTLLLMNMTLLIAVGIGFYGLRTTAMKQVNNVRST